MQDYLYKVVYIQYIYTLYPTMCRFPIHSPTKNQQYISAATKIFMIPSRTVTSR